MQTLRIGVREAKINLSKLLKRVQEGHSVIITDRGRPVGKLIPADTSSLPLRDRLKALENQGWIDAAPKGKVNRLPPPLPAPGKLAVQNLLQEDRNR